MFVCCECCVSGRCLCDKLITRPEESYRQWCVVVCDLENLKNEEDMTRAGSQRHSKKLNSHSMKWLCCFVSVGFALLFSAFFYLALYSFYAFLYSASIFPPITRICCFHPFFCTYVPFSQSNDR
jgi:hypothetical protein